MNRRVASATLGFVLFLALCYAQVYVGGTSVADGVDQRPRIAIANLPEFHGTSGLSSAGSMATFDQTHPTAHPLSPPQIYFSTELPKPMPVPESPPKVAPTPALSQPPPAVTPQLPVDTDSVHRPAAELLEPNHAIEHSRLQVDPLMLLERPSYETWLDKSFIPGTYDDHGHYSVPDAEHILKFNEVRECLKDKNVLFIGDSLNRYQFDRLGAYLSGDKYWGQTFPDNMWDVLRNMPYYPPCEFEERYRNGGGRCMKFYDKDPKPYHFSGFTRLDYSTVALNTRLLYVGGFPVNAKRLEALRNTWPSIRVDLLVAGFQIHAHTESNGAIERNWELFKDVSYSLWPQARKIWHLTHWRNTRRVPKRYWKSQGNERVRTQWAPVEVRVFDDPEQNWAVMDQYWFTYGQTDPLASRDGTHFNSTINMAKLNVILADFCTYTHPEGLLQRGN